MSSVVHKFIVPIPNAEGLSRIKMPVDSVVMSAGVQGVEIVVWVAMTEFTSFFDERIFLVVNTGRSFEWPSKNREFIDTVNVDGTVWHLFEVS